MLCLVALCLMIEALGPPTAELPSTGTFIENQGQWTDSTEFVSFGRSMTLGVTGNSLSILASCQVKKTPSEKTEKQSQPPTVSPPERGHVPFRLTFEGASANPRAIGRSPTAGRHHFLRGARETWRANVPGFRSVVIEDLYPGVDLVVRLWRGVFEYDLLLDSHAKLDDIVVRCEGHETMSIGLRGQLELSHPTGRLEQPRPRTWQRTDRGLRSVAAHFVIVDDQRYGFCVPDAEPGLPLIIDPGLLWSTFVGGNAIDEVKAMTRAPNGDLILAGVVSSPDFPTTAGAFDPTHNGTNTDVTITRLSADGNTLVYSTFLGGALAQEGPGAVRLSPDGRVTVAGTTWSADFPSTPGSFDATYDATHGGQYSDAFVTQLVPDGSSLVYSTFLGGPLDDSARGLALDPGGRAYVTGYAAEGFPTSPNAASSSVSGINDGFLLRLTSDGSAVEYASYVGGSATDRGLRLALPPSGDVIVAGTTLSVDFPVTLDAFDAQGDGAPGNSDGFLLRFDPGDNLVYASYFGGAASDEIEDMTLLPDGAILVCGSTLSDDFPVTGGAAQATRQAQDGFVSCFSPAGDSLRFSTLLGGSGADLSVAVAVESTGAILVAGDTLSLDFPVTPDGAQTMFGGASIFGGDSYLVRLSAFGSAILYGTYFGGTDAEHVFALTPGATDQAIAAGLTLSVDYPTTPGSLDPTYNGGIADSFVTAIELTQYAPPDRLRGDANDDGQVNIADGVSVLSYLFNQAPLSCLDAADINASITLDIADAVGIFGWVFGVGPQPAPPFPDCGPPPGGGLPCEVTGC